MSIKSNIEKIKERMAISAREAGRNPEDITLIAVTKLHGVDEINEAIDCGITDIGENKVQEILEKYEKVKPVKWHLIGHLQTNKVKYIIDKVSMIHSVDSVKLAKEINKRAIQHGITMDILVQVNIAEEESKFGAGAEEVSSIIDEITESCENIKIRGIMCIAPMLADINEARPYFAEAKRIFDSYLDDKREKVDFKYLSMGMTGDFPVAIEEGSNMVRVGTAIFGMRDYRWS